MARDTIALRREAIPGGTPLLQPVMADGRITRPLPTLSECRDYFQAQFARLPEAHKVLQDPTPYPVSLSPGLTGVTIPGGAADPAPGIGRKLNPWD